MNSSSGPYRKLLRRVLGQEIETYGFNDLVRMRSGYPGYLPLPFNIYHGWYVEAPRPADLRHPASLVLAFSKRQADEWQAVSDRPVAVLGAPFVHYRRMKGIRRRDDARGTIVYPGHDATSIEGMFDQKKFCEVLAALDRKYHPITVSVHEKDIEAGKDMMYRDYGIETFCPGPRNTIAFCENFYLGLSRHRYSCGNHFGTNILYAVEMGIPFFFIGKMVVGVDRRTGRLIEKDRTPEHLALLDRVRTLFAEPVDEVTPEQMALVLSESGVDDCLSPAELRRLLLRMLFLREMPQVLARLAKWPANAVRRRRTARAG